MSTISYSFNWPARHLQRTYIPIGRNCLAIVCCVPAKLTLKAEMGVSDDAPVNSGKLCPATMLGGSIAI